MTQPIGLEAAGANRSGYLCRHTLKDEMTRIAARSGSNKNFNLFILEKLA